MKTHTHRGKENVGILFRTVWYFVTFDRDIEKFVEKKTEIKQNDGEPCYGIREGLHLLPPTISYGRGGGPQPL